MHGLAESDNCPSDRYRRRQLLESLSFLIFPLPARNSVAGVSAPAPGVIASRRWIMDSDKSRSQFFSPAKPAFARESWAPTGRVSVQAHLFSEGESARRKVR